MKFLLVLATVAGSMAAQADQFDLGVAIGDVSVSIRDRDDHGDWDNGRDHGRRDSLRDAIRDLDRVDNALRRSTYEANNLLNDVERTLEGYPYDNSLRQASTAVRRARGLVLDPRLPLYIKINRVRSETDAAQDAIRRSRSYREENDHGGGGGYYPPEPPHYPSLRSFPGECIGGEKCGRGNSLVMNFGGYRGEYVERIEFYAHDDIGDSKEGAVAVYADGRMVSSYIDILKRGSTHSVSIRDNVRTIEIRPVTDDEVKINSVTAFLR